MTIKIDAKIILGILTAAVVFLQAVIGLLESGVAGVPGV